MYTRAPERAVRKHIVVLCLLTLAAVLGVSVAASAHIHKAPDVHDAQCTLCMTFAQTVAVCVAVSLIFLLKLEAEEHVREIRFVSFSSWLPPSQWGRPPPIA